MAGRLRDFWQRISDGIAIQQLWAEFHADARSSYRFYSKEVDSIPIQGESRWKRFWRIARALFWAMMMKLSPGRRILLLIALVLPLHPINLNKYRRRKRAPGKIPHRPLAGVVQFAELTAATGAPDLSISSFTPYPQFQRLCFLGDIMLIDLVPRPSQDPRELVIRRQTASLAQVQ
jgi:hypothetical protein